MNITPSDYGQPYEAPAKTKEKTTKSHYRRRGLDFSRFSKDLDQNFQVHNFNSYRNYPNISAIGERRKDQEILDPEKEKQDREFPERKDKDVNLPNVEEPKKDKDWMDDDDAVIEEPTRELDGPYKRGHADRENTPPIKEDLPDTDPKENSETH